MSHTFEVKREPCPCGKGIVIHWEKEDDHPWVLNWSTYTWTETRCEECQKKMPTLSSSQIENLEQIAVERAALEHEREQIHAAVVSHEFPADKYPSMAAEWRAVREQKVFSASYNIYRRRRKSGMVYNAIRWGVTDDWVIKRCGGTHRDRLTAICQRLAELAAQEKAIRQAPAGGDGACRN